MTVLTLYVYVYSCITLFLLYIQSMSSTHASIYLLIYLSYLSIHLSILELSPNASNGVIASMNNSKMTPHVSKTDRCRPPHHYLPIPSIYRSSYHIHQPYSIDIIIIIIILMTIIITNMTQHHHNYHHGHHHYSSIIIIITITTIFIMIIIVIIYHHPYEYHSSLSSLLFHILGIIFGD